MIVNYFYGCFRSSPLNLSAARVLICVYALWKLVSYDFTALQYWPKVLFEMHPHGSLVLFGTMLQWLWVEVVLTAACLALVLAGIRVRIAAPAAALLLAHMSAVHYVVTNSGSTWLPAVFFLILYAVFDGTDSPPLKPRLASTDRTKPVRTSPGYDHSALKWTQLIIALTYFFTGYSKLAKAGLSWLAGENLSKILCHEALMLLNDIPTAAHFIIDSPILATVSATAAVALEVGFVVALLTKKPLLPFVVGLSAMHFLIFLSMRILFFDQFILFLLFLPYDKLWERVHRFRDSANFTMDDGVSNGKILSLKTALNLPRD